MSLPTYKEFKNFQEHDFLYYHSDDHSVYMKGQAKAKELQGRLRADYLGIMIKRGIRSMSEATHGGKGDRYRSVDRKKYDANF